jgi:hypothetical protein
MRRLRAFGLGVAALATFQLSGLHVMMWQCVAWANMIVDYSQTSGLLTAVGETFDGDHPCALCKQIAQSDAESKSHQAKFLDYSFQGLKAVRTEALAPMKAPSILRQAFIFPGSDRSLPSLATRPPIPPPRSV